MARGSKILLRNKAKAVKDVSVKDALLAIIDSVSITLDSGMPSIEGHNHDDRYFTETEIDNVFSGSVLKTGYNKSQWDTAYSWGNHAAVGYLTAALAASTYVALAGSYSNPSWLNSLPWTKITGTPATYAPSPHLHTTTDISNLSSYTGFDARYYTETEINSLLSAKENAISFGTALQYFRGDKTWQTLNTSAVPEGSNLYFTNARADARINAMKAIANGLATLDSSGKLNTSQLPALAITDTFVVASEAAMLALTVDTGDVAVRTDLNKSFILKGTNPALLSEWTELLTPTDNVLSVNGQGGVVSLNTGHIPEGANLYYTNARVKAYADTLYSALGHTHTTTDITNLSSYTGFDARYHTETEISSFFSGGTAITGYNKTNWDAAFGWGNHASAGYLTTAAAASTYVALAGSYANPTWITSLAWAKITGAPATYAPSAHTLDSHSNVTITSNTNGEILRWNGTAWINNTLAEAGIQAAGSYASASHTHTTADITNLSSYTGYDARYYTETEISSFFSGGTAITGYNKTNWDAAFSWGNHATAGYLGTALAASTYVSLSGSYANPTWLTSLAWSKITGAPSTYAPSAHSLDSHSNVTITANTVGEILKWDGSAWINNTLAEAGIQAAGSYAAATHTHTTSDISNLSSYTGFDARYFTETESDARFVALAGSYANPTWITSLAWSKITGVPTLNQDTTGFAGYLRMQTIPSVSGGTDMNTISSSLIQNYGSVSYWVNAAGIAYGFGYTQKQSTSMAYQFMYDIRHGNTDYGDLYYRTLNNSTIWSGWAKIWHSLNDGVGSGLDSDLLDGQHGSYYLSRANHTGTQLASTISDLASYTGFDARYFTETESDARFVALAGSYVNPTWITSLAWSKITGVPSTYAPSAHTLDSHSNVTITSNTDGEILRWNGTAWINNTLFEAGIQPAGSYALASHTHVTDDITNLSIYTGFDARYYTETEISSFFSGGTAITGYNKTNWDAAFGWGNHASAGYLLSATAASTYVALGGSYANPTWITSLAWAKITGAPATYAPSAHTLDSHSNVTITSNTNGEILRWNGTAWINNTLAEAGIQAAGSYAAASHTHTTTDITNLSSYTGFDARYFTETESDARFVALAGSYANPTWITSIAWSKITGAPATYAPSAHTLDSHSNVTITSNTNGEILRWNGTAWINNTLAEAGIQAAGSYAAASHTHTTTDITNLSSYTGFDARYFTESEINSILTGYVTEARFGEVLLGNIPMPGYNNFDWDNAVSWGDHSVAGYVLTTGTYANPSWITSLAWSKITGAPATYTPSAHTLDSHSNVTITSNTNGEILRWTGTAWINNTLAEAGIQAAGSYANTVHTHSTSDISNLSTYTGFDSRYYTESEIVTMLTNYITTNTAQTINVNKSFGPSAGSYTRAFFHVTGAAGATAAMFGTTYPIALGGNFPGIYFNTYYNGAWKIANGTAVYGAGITFSPTDGTYRIYQMPTTANADATISPSITMSLTKEGNLTAIGSIEAWGQLRTKSTLQTEAYPGAGVFGEEWNLYDILGPEETEITHNLRVFVDGRLFHIHATEKLA